MAQIRFPVCWDFKQERYLQVYILQKYMYCTSVNINNTFSLIFWKKESWYNDSSLTRSTYTYMLIKVFIKPPISCSCHGLTCTSLSDLIHQFTIFALWKKFGFFLHKNFEFIFWINCPIVDVKHVRYCISPVYHKLLAFIDIK